MRNIYFDDGGAPDGGGSGGAPSGSLIAGGSGGASPADPPAGGAGGAAPDGGGTGVKEPFYKNWFGEDGNFTEKEWASNLPEDLQPYSNTFSKYKSINELMHGFGNLSRMATGKGLQPLPPNASDQLKQEFAEQMRKANGVPENPSDYGVSRPEEVPEELWNEDRASKFAEVLHKHHAPPELVKELFALNTADTLAAIQDAETRAQVKVEESVQELQKEWGDEFEANKMKARRGAATLGLDPDNDPVFEHPGFVKAMVKLTNMVSEDRLVSGDDDSSSGQSDLQKALDIMQNPSNPLHAAFHDPKHPQHDFAVKQRSMFNARYAARQKKAA